MASILAFQTCPIYNSLILFNKGIYCTMHFHKALSNCIQAGYVILFLLLISKVKIFKLYFLYLIFCESCFFSVIFFS